MKLHTLWVVGLLLVAAFLRFIAAASAPPVVSYDDRGGDSGWYLLNGLALVGGSVPAGYAVEISNLQPPPGYLLFVGAAQRLAALPDAVGLIRAAQSLLGVVTCYLAYRIARRLGGERAAIAALAVFALSPVLILESSRITSETLYLCLLAGAFAAYFAALNSPGHTQLRTFMLSGVLFGLATLTRAVLLLFPLGLSIHLLVIYPRRRSLTAAAALLTVFMITVSTWTIYSYARWNRWVIAGEGFASFIYLGASGWSGPREVDQGLQADATEGATFESWQDQYFNAALNVITRDLPAYLRRRLVELAGSYLQPHGTAYFPGESLREMGMRWLTQERTLDGLLRLVQSDGFWPKLVLYAFHYATLVFGALGMWVMRRLWRFTMPLVGFVVYVTLLHVVLLALPRYIFPTVIAWYIFSALWWTRQSSSASTAAR